MNEKQFSKSVQMMQEFIANIKQGKNPMYVGKDFICMSRKYHDEEIKQVREEERKILISDLIGEYEKDKNEQNKK